VSRGGGLRQQDVLPAVHGQQGKTDTSHIVTLYKPQVYDLSQHINHFSTTAPGVLHSLRLHMKIGGITSIFK